MIKSSILAGLLVSFIPFVALAAEDLPKPIQRVKAEGYSIERSFPAVSSLTGWVIKSPDGEHTIMFTTPDRKTLIAGALLDEGGRPLMGEYVQRYIPKPDLASLWTDLEDASVITEGASGANAKSTIYVFLDPDCTYCNLTWKALAPYQKIGLQVKWVPVSIFPNSKKTTTLMMANDSAAFTAYQKNYGTPAATKSFKAPKSVEAISKQLASNSELMSKFGFKGTPGIVYKDPQTGVVTTINGFPKLSTIPQFTGLPLQVNNDPMLRKFQ